jgi:glutamyl-tRNA reductase
VDRLVQVGVDHRSAPLAVRERVALDAPRVRALLGAVRAEGWADEALVLSTCNRTEVYVASPAEGAAAPLALAALRRAAPEAPPEEEGVYLTRQGDVAAEHLMRVAAGLESAVLGETEIQGQVREAHRLAREAKALGPFLDRLASGALRAGRRARAETGLSAGAVSHGQAALEVARRIFGGAKEPRVLVVGAGVMATQAAGCLASLPGARFTVANRTREAAEALAGALPSARATGLDEVAAALAEAHVAVFAGGEGALSRAALEAAAKERRDPLLVLDLGVPRCVDPTVADVAGVFLYDLEAVEALLARSLEGRRLAVPAAEALVAEEIEDFRAWERRLVATPAIRSLAEWAETLRRAELDRLPASTPPETRAAVEEATRRLVERLLRRPAARVRQGVERGDPALPTPDHLRNVFGLGEGDDEAGAPPP